MNKYESIIIVSPNVGEKTIKELIEQIKKIIVDNEGNFIRAVEMGKKKLAYRIRYKEEAFYIQLVFEVNSNVISELERIYRIKDEIIKFITVRIEED